MQALIIEYGYNYVIMLPIVVNTQGTVPKGLED